MKTKLKVKRHGVAALLFSTLVMVGCVQSETLLPPEEIQTIGNVDATRFIEIINKQPHQLTAFKEKVKDKHVFYERTKLYTNADYGLTFFIPYSNLGSDVVNGAIYYPVENEIGNDNKVVLKETLRSAHFIDADKINNSIPITKRFLYAHDFADLEEQGCVCNKDLIQYEFLKDTEITIHNEDKPLTRTPPTFIGTPHLELHMYVNSKYIGKNTDEIVALSKESLRKWVDETLKWTVWWPRVCYVGQVGYNVEVDIPEELLVRLHLKPEEFVWKFTNALEREAFSHDFSLYIHYHYTYYRKDPEKDTVEDKTGYIGPKADETKTGAIAEPEEKKEKDRYDTIEDDCEGIRDAAIPKMNMEQMINDLFAAKALQGTNYNFITFSDFESTVSQDLDHEYSTSVDEWFDERVINPVQTNNMPYNVDSHSGETTVFTIHSHINKKPPSPQDLLQICTVAADIQGRPKYKGTLVYIPQDSTFYGLIIKDRAKAARMAEVLASEINKANDFVQTGMCYNLLNKNRRCYENLSPTETEITKLALILRVLDTGIVLVKHSRKQGKTTTMYDVAPVMSKKRKASYKPIKCQ